VKWAWPLRSRGWEYLVVVSYRDESDPGSPRWFANGTVDDGSRGGTSSVCDAGWVYMSDEEIQNWLRYVLEEIDRVGSRLDEFLGTSVDGLYRSLAMVPNATRRIMTEISPGTAQDSCAVLHASRFFNNTTAAFILLRKGMLVEAIPLPVRL
jgi:hypothetical protein